MSKTLPFARNVEGAGPSNNKPVRAPPINWVDNETEEKRRREGVFAILGPSKVGLMRKAADA